MRTINRKIIGISGIIFITIVFIFNSNRKMMVPKIEDLTNIILIDVTEKISSKRTTISNKTDIAKLLKIFKKSKRTNKKSISNFPIRSEFTTVLFEFKSGGNSFRSIYEESNNVYIDQPFHGIFKIISKDIYLLHEIKKGGKEEEFIVTLKDILKDDFKE